ncbi:L antigen family member 3-like precursor [Salmo salar]|uniref:EKC/KEOPS complex subunit LAGE3 precursor n=1 Tax=Salmo salar TaxID=8030 RepID=B5X5J8_SALSA|nr:L antigen family member 3-like precursor [Salmo salar]ACI66118.1 L antigen family member 3 [Salmo salar]|eukprot:NP_001134070.1 EKC/KEOPS complex subunit LAGE3 precursor [Salmo salar]
MVVLLYTRLLSCIILTVHVMLSPSSPVSSVSLSIRRWRADEARILRVSVGSFMDHLSLVMETMEAFGPPVSVTTQTHSCSTMT